MEGDWERCSLEKSSTEFQSTPSAWRETIFGVPISSPSQISIHSLRMEGDRAQPPRERGTSVISIHSLRMEGDSKKTCIPGSDSIFQSTPSAWRETCGTQTLSNNMEKFQSTPSAWRETFSFSRAFVTSHIFQSTPSAWRETAKLHRKAFFISPILVQSCKKGCKRLHSAPEKMVFFEKREKNLVRNLQHLSVRL